MAYPILASNSTWYKSTQKRSTITQINIVDTYSGGTADETWNADVNNSGSIKCYRSGTVLTIAGNGSGKIAMNPDSSYLFSSTSSSNVFKNVTSINGAEVLDASGATTFYNMFTYCEKLVSVNVSTWDTSNVENMRSMFMVCLKLSALDVSTWNTSKCTTMRAMFQCCLTLDEINVSGWDVSKVTSMQSMFAGHASYGNMSIRHIYGLENWTTPQVVEIAGMFNSCPNLKTANVGGFNISKVTSLQEMFYNCSSLQSIDVSSWDVSKVENMKYMFSYCSSLRNLNVSEWNTSSCVNMAGMLGGCSSIELINISNWDVSKVTTFDHFLSHSYATLDGDGVARWVTSSAQSMNAMFYSCQNEIIDVSNFDTSNVLTFAQMFEDCNKLRKIIGLENFMTSTSLSFAEMFSRCSNLEELNLSAFDTRNATDGAEHFGRPDETTSTMRGFFPSEIGALKKVIIGKNFSFNGDGATTTNIAVLPTPSSGMWYNASGEPFAPKDVPDGINATYFSNRADIDRDVLVKYGTLTHVADAIRDKCDISSEISVSEYATEIMSIGSKSIPYVDYNLDTDGNVVGAVAYNFVVIPSYMFYNFSSLEDMDFSQSPNIESIGTSAFYACKKLTFARFPKVEELKSSAFASCSSLVALELGNIKRSVSTVFSSTNLLSAIILKSSEEVTSGVFSNFPTSIRTKGGTDYAEQGYIYVPQLLIESYQANNPDFRFRAIEDYPEISIYRWKRFTPANSYVFDGWETYEGYYDIRDTGTVSVYRDFEVNTSGKVVGVGSYSSMAAADIVYVLNGGGNLYYRYSSTDVRKIVRVEDKGSSEYYRYRMYYVQGNVKSEKDWSNLGSETTAVSSDPEYYPDKGNNGTYYFEKDGEIKITV